ncbi:MAG TPA: glycosyltransferase family 87 protein [Pyrinomonadaceae bacterium]|nr:glycosyltransferase family 87 protein [Pyrinomonadaceae bacterium]
MRSFIERRLNQPYIRRISILVLAVYLIVLTVSFATAKRGRTVFGPFLGADFGAFYVAGQIFNQYEPASIYDGSLHRQLYKENFPDAPLDEELSYANAPFFVIPFIFLSRLPYTLAYAIWLAISVSLYLAGFAILWRALQSFPQELWLTALLLALSFWPFLVECLAGGQTSAVGFFWLALAITLEPRRRFWSGLALAMCAYKPTLLFLVVPMLLVTGRWMSLAGLVVGNLVLALVSLAVVGVQGCLNFINRLLFYSTVATSTEAGLRSWKYVDINAFMRLLFPHQTDLRWAITAALVLAIIPFLVSSWRRLRGASQWQLLWALTLTWTPVLNIYMGIYDSTILVLAVLLLTAEFYRSRTELPFAYQCLLLVLYLSPWFTQNIALMTRLQIYTLAVAALGIYQFRLDLRGERGCDGSHSRANWEG